MYKQEHSHSHTYLVSPPHMLNKSMNNEQFLQTAYNETKALGFVDNQWDFSLICVEGRVLGLAVSKQRTYQ